LAIWIWYEYFNIIRKDSLTPNSSSTISIVAFGLIPDPLLIKDILPDFKQLLYLAYEFGKGGFLQMISRL